jgi:hypothetical protein
MFRFKKPNSVIEFGKQNYEQVATIRAAIERLHARDMVSLHDVKAFLLSKNKPDPGFVAMRLKR